VNPKAQEQEKKQVSLVKTVAKNRKLVDNLNPRRKCE
jgi:hypothetical protein